VAALLACRRQRQATAEPKPVRADRSPQLQERMPPAVLQPARALAAVRRERPLATVLLVLALVGRR
jgi:hypothetical protein